MLSLFFTCVTVLDLTLAVGKWRNEPRRRKKKRLRSFWKHEQLYVWMAVASTVHHTHDRSKPVVAADVQVRSGHAQFFNMSEGSGDESVAFPVSTVRVLVRPGFAMPLLCLGLFRPFLSSADIPRGFPSKARPVPQWCGDGWRKRRAVERRIKRALGGYCRAKFFWWMR